MATTLGHLGTTTKGETYPGRTQYYTLDSYAEQVGGQSGYGKQRDMNRAL